jgi:hypothetical protein
MTAGAAEGEDSRSAATEHIGEDELQLPYFVAAVCGAEQAIVLDPQAGPA